MDILYQLDILSRIVIAMLGGALFLQVLYYFAIYIRPVCRNEHKSTPPSELPPVSVIVCARNEREELERGLPILLAQDYPEFEVIVVNDCSEDDTEEKLTEMKLNYPNLRSTIIRNDTDFVNNKKFAATIGIKAARYEWLLFTDASCVPAGERWISSMSRFFTEKKDIVTGIAGFTQGKGLLNKWIQYVTVFYNLRDIGFAMCRMPFVGINRNLAYRKSLFFENNGFAMHSHIMSGAYDLVATEAATRTNVAACLSPDGQTIAPARTTFRAWVRQQCGYYAVLSHISGFRRFLLWLEPFSRIVFWASCIVACLLQPALWYVFVGAFVVRTVFFLIIFGLFMKKLRIRNIVPFALFFDIAAPFIHPYIYFTNRKLVNRWK